MYCTVNTLQQFFIPQVLNYGKKWLGINVSLCFKAQSSPETVHLNCRIRYYTLQLKNKIKMMEGFPPPFFCKKCKVRYISKHVFFQKKSFFKCITFIQPFSSGAWCLLPPKKNCRQYVHCCCRQYVCFCCCRQYVLSPISMILSVANTSLPQEESKSATATYVGTEKIVGRGREKSVTGWGVEISPQGVGQFE